MQARWVLVVLLCGWRLLAAENLARQASIRADSEYSTDYAARLVADGQIPAALEQADRGAAWAVDGATHRAGATVNSRQRCGR